MLRRPKITRSYLVTRIVPGARSGGGTYRSMRALRAGHPEQITSVGAGNPAAGHPGSCPGRRASASVQSIRVRSPVVHRSAAAANLDVDLHARNRRVLSAHGGLSTITLVYLGLKLHSNRRRRASRSNNFRRLPLVRPTDLVCTDAKQSPPTSGCVQLFRHVLVSAAIAPLLMASGQALAVVPISTAAGSYDLRAATWDTSNPRRVCQDFFCNVVIVVPPESVVDAKADAMRVSFNPTILSPDSNLSESVTATLAGISSTASAKLGIVATTVDFGVAATAAKSSVFVGRSSGRVAVRLLRQGRTAVPRLAGFSDSRCMCRRLHAGDGLPAPDHRPARLLGRSRRRCPCQLRRNVEHQRPGTGVRRILHRGRSACRQSAFAGGFR